MKALRIVQVQSTHSKPPQRTFRSLYGVTGTQNYQKPNSFVASAMPEGILQDQPPNDTETATTLRAISKTPTAIIFVATVCSTLEHPRSCKPQNCVQARLTVLNMPSQQASLIQSFVWFGRKFFYSCHRKLLNISEMHPLADGVDTISCEPPLHK